jgi:hypothetical protein
VCTVREDHGGNIKKKIIQKIFGPREVYGKKNYILWVFVSSPVLTNYIM